MREFEHGGNDLIDYKNPYRELPEVENMTGVIIHESHECEHNGFGHVNKYIVSGADNARGVENGFTFLVLNCWGSFGFREGLWEIFLFDNNDKGFVNPLASVPGIGEGSIRIWINRTISLLRSERSE